MKFKKTIAGAVTAATLLFALAGCGSSTPAAGNSTAAPGEETVTVKLGVVGSIYEDLWQPTKDALVEEGIDLQFVQFSDYATPNNALANG